MHEPTPLRQCHDADPLTVSSYIAQAAKRALTSRAPPDAYLATDLYQILITPQSGESYQPETPWPVMCSKRQTLDHLMDQLFADCTARVIFRPVQGKPEDVSEDFAKLYVYAMHESGADAQAILGIKFVGKYLTNDEVDDICGNGK
jgi:hypothetical protein